MEPILQARNLIKHFGRVTALDGADFDLLPGEILAVIGDNGAGESVMIKSLTGAIQFDSGEIKMDGKPLSNIDDVLKLLENKRIDDRSTFQLQRNNKVLTVEVVFSQTKK